MNNIAHHESGMNPPCTQSAPDRMSKNEKFKCKFCNKEFKFHQNMYRHQKYRCKTNKLENDNSLKEENKELKKQNNKLLNLATSNADVAKKSMSVMNYALKNYNDAPPIGLLEDDQFNKMSELLTHDEKGKKKTDKSTEEILIFHHRHDTLNKVLGDLIVKIYKKENPDKQSVWSSDISRLTFIVKDIVGKTKNSKWITDKKGLHFTQVIINPLLDKIKTLLMEYVFDCGNKINKITSKHKLEEIEENKTRSLLSQMQEANLTILTIKLGKIHGEILKYIAPYFNLKVD